MNFRVGIILSGSLAIGLAGCASSGGGGGDTTAPPTTGTPGAELLAQGESPRPNEMTRAAADALEEARDADTPQQARPFYQAALASAEQAIAADPRNPLPHYQAAQAHLGLENYAEAGASFDEAERLRPIYRLETEGLRERVWIELYQEAAPLVNQGRYAEAIPIFESANAIYKNRPEVMITLGQVYMAEGEPDMAVENFEEARVLIASDRLMEMDEETQASWREQGEQLPALIAQAYLSAQRYEEAAQALRDLLAEDPDDVVLQKNLASVYVELDQPDSARVIYDRLAARSDLEAADYYQVGVGYYQMDDLEAAGEAFEAAAGAAVNDRDALEMWARSAQSEMQATISDGGEPAPALLDEIMEAGERWLALDPNNTNAHIIVAQAANRAGNADRARELVNMAEGLAVVVDNLQLRRASGGGGMVTGSVRNKTLSPGTQITLDFTFYDAAGTPIGSEQATVRAPAAEASELFRIEIQSDRTVDGYGYTITTM